MPSLVMIKKKYALLKEERQSDTRSCAFILFTFLFLAKCKKVN
jgi:hypothetical protein